MRKEVRNIVFVFLLISALGGFVIANAAILPSAGSDSRLPIDGLLQVVLWASIAVFLVVQSTLAIRTLQLLRHPRLEAVEQNGSSHLALDAIWTVLPLVLAVAVGAYSHFWL